MKRNLHAGRRRSGGLRLEVFTRDELDDIHLATLEVLQRTGVWVEDEEAVAIFAAAGATVTGAGATAPAGATPSAGATVAGVDAGAYAGGAMVRIPPHLIEDAIRSAPSKVVLCGRSPANDVVLEDGRVGFTNFGEGIQIVDPYTGRLREPLKQDVADCAKIVDALPEIDVLERPLGAHDVPQESAPLHNAEAIFANTTKHATIGPLTGFCARAMIDMAAVIAGAAASIPPGDAGVSPDGAGAGAARRAALRARPILSFLTCPVSPLKLVADCCRIIIEGARAGIPVNVLSMAMAGASAPVNLAGTLVTHNAEVLAGITLAQLTAKGAPIVYGSSTTAMDLRFASASVGSPECALINAGVACLARSYLLPSWVAGA